MRITKLNENISPVFGFETIKITHPINGGKKGQLWAPEAFVHYYYYVGKFKENVKIWE